MAGKDDIVEIYGKKISISKYRDWLRTIQKEFAFMNKKLENQMTFMTIEERREFYRQASAFKVEKSDVAVKYSKIANAEDLKIIKELSDGILNIINSISLKSGKDLIEDEKGEGEPSNEDEDLTLQFAEENDK